MQNIKVCVMDKRGLVYSGWLNDVRGDKLEIITEESYDYLNRRMKEDYVKREISWKDISYIRVSGLASEIKKMCQKIREEIKE